MSEQPAFDCTSDHIMCATWQALTQQNVELRKALETLCDEQNGPPRYKSEAAWNAAMSEAYRLLGRPEWKHQTP